MTTPSFDIELLLDGASHYGLSLSDHQVSQYERYFSFLCDWNTRVNLISRNDLSRFVSYHILDSLKSASIFDFSSTGMMCDFGSGSGVPGIPLAIAFPDCHIDLIESRRKRCEFLDHATKELCLTRCHIVCNRAERYIADSSPLFDTIVTRATCSLSTFFSIFQHCVITGGSFVSIKGNIDSSERDDLLLSVPRDRFSISFTHPVEFSPVRTGNIVIIKSI